MSYEERERLREQAQREGKSLSGWIRDAANSVYEQRQRSLPMDADDVRELFDGCSRVSSDEPLPDWPTLKSDYEAIAPDIAAAIIDELRLR